MKSPPMKMKLKKAKSIPKTPNPPEATIGKIPQWRREHPPQGHNPKIYVMKKNLKNNILANSGKMAGESTDKSPEHLGQDYRCQGQKEDPHLAQQKFAEVPKHPGPAQKPKSAESQHSVDSKKSFVKVVAKEKSKQPKKEHSKDASLHKRGHGDPKGLL